ncbi:MAG: CRISPR-associated protein Cas4 [Candidatus Aminicenantes bacterium]|nr:CRISPR-associated protein Cas4 [Candidatus Aminicenantes bacterium]
MRYSEDDLLPVSAIQHLLFCERQCALIHLEQVWDENVLTAEGRQQHDRCDEMASETRGDVLIARGLYIQNLELGLTGKADVVEFHRAEAAGMDAVPLKIADGFWKPFPVEYKHGRPKTGMCDEAQLCAQAMCLEEMLKVHIEAGALYYQKPRRRTPVEFSESLRQIVKAAAFKLHELIRNGVTPPAVNDKRCDNCSLKNQCLPGCTSGKHLVNDYLLSSLKNVGAEKSEGMS